MKSYRASIVFIAFCLWAATGTARAQKGTSGAVLPVPQLAGTWVADIKAGSKVSERTLTITQTDDELTVEEDLVYDGKPLTNLMRLLLNGKGEKNSRVFPGDNRSVEIDSQTKVKKGKIVRTYSLGNTVFGNNFIQSNVTEQFYMKGADILIVENSSVSNGRINGGRRSNFAGNNRSQTQKSLATASVYSPSHLARLKW